MVISSVRDMQVLARTRRLELGLTQSQVAERAGVSRKWLVNFEGGTATAVELSLVLRLFAALKIPLTTSSPDSPALLEPEPRVDLGGHLAAVTARSARLFLDTSALAGLATGDDHKALWSSEAMQRLAATIGPGMEKALSTLRESVVASPDRTEAEAEAEADERAADAVDELGP